MSTWKKLTESVASKKRTPSPIARIENKGRIKLSTKVQIANEIAKDQGGRPVMTMNELHAALAPLTAPNRNAMRDTIKRAIFA